VIQTDDDCQLWVADEGHGTPVVICHGGPGLWDMTGSLIAEVLLEYLGVSGG
jgi:proline iminopeptidase